MTWIMENLATLVIGGLLLALVIWAICQMIRDRKSGTCSCGCNACSHAGSCQHHSN